MLTVTRKAAAVLKAAKAAQGARPETGIRILQGSGSEQEESQSVSVGFAFSDAPHPNDEALEQDGLRIFVESSLIDTLDGRTLDVWTDGDDGPELLFR
jgi:Fe-S cluster assembly iron-binding protein IscA